MASKCLFESRGDYRCSESCTNLIKLSTIPECEIIINRCCLPLDLSPYQLEQLWICQKHRDAMTKDWRPRLTCQYPLHSGTKKKLSTRNVITAELSKQIDTMYGERVPTGSPICVSCSNRHKLKLTENRVWMQKQPSVEYESVRLAKRIGAMNLDAMSTTPCVTTPVSNTGKQTKDWTLGCFSDDLSSEDEEAISSSGSAMPVFNAAIETLNQVATNADPVSPLTFQLKTTWSEATEYEKEVCIDKATEACNLLCDIIAPKAGPELFKSCCNQDEDTHEDLVPLMHAYSKATTRNVKTQILSLYAYRYPVRTLQRIHEPYERLTDWHIRRARVHAKECGPGLLVEKSSFHRVRLPRVKLDHFIDFVNRPYFYQDVAFGTRKLVLSGGKKVEMPNVIRKVTRSTMIKQYLQFCTEENVEPLSRATLFRILEVREASQQKSLSGLDNTAADGSAAFERLHEIVDELDQIGLDKTEADHLRKSLANGKKYFKTEYPNHCKDSESLCADHCRKFGLSDPNDTDFQEKCTHGHGHVLRCPQCDEVFSCLHKINTIVKDDKTLSFYNKDHQDDLLYDIEKALEAVDKWKGHVMRSINQEMAKQDIIAELDQSSCLLIVDWAMKFLQVRFREKQNDWYGKRGLSWHISSVISRNQSDTVDVMSYAHLFDQCTQDWYAVSSIIEDLINEMKSKNLQLQTVFLRSDEAGCYHNNFLIAALRDIGERVGVKVQAYHYSEPQAGKDICDRILCPMKHAIRTYSNEGHDILTAVHMRDALLQHPVKGTTAAVSTVNESKKTLSIKNIQDFSAFHSFSYEETGLRVWKCYGIGKGKLILYEDIYINHQKATELQTKESQGFFDPPAKRELKQRSEAKKMSKTQLFECSVPDCEAAFETFAQLQLHLDVGKHRIKNMNQYDEIKLDWALKFSSVDTTHTDCNYPLDDQTSQISQKCTSTDSSLQRGWALSKPRSNARFSDKVKDYLRTRFDIGERTGKKADPAQVVLDMRCARDECNGRLFTRTEWLTKTQIQGFFSRMAAARRKQGLLGLSDDHEDVRCLQENSERHELVEMINKQINVLHPICYDAYDLCERYHSKTLKKFDVAMLKTICNHFEIPFKSRDKKQVLIDKVSDMINDCECVSRT